MQPTLRELYNLGPDDTIVHQLWPADTHPIDLRCYNYATMVRRGYILPGTSLRPHSTLGLFNPSTWVPDFYPITARNVHRAVLHDGFHHLPTAPHSPPPQAPHGHSLIAVMLETGKNQLPDVHSLRHHPVHGFSFKWGDDKVMFTDLSGNRITDPRTANLGTYRKLVGFYHAPLEGLPNHHRTDFIDKPVR